MSVQPSFIFGGDTGVQTPEDLARLRAIADALARPAAPRTIGQGLNALGEAIGYRMADNRATQAEHDWRKGGDSVFSALFGAGGGSASTSSPGASSDGGSPGNLPAVDVSGSVSGSVDPKTLFAGLKARGLNDAQAYATLGNWKQESEFRPGAINPGEGAMGFTQWRDARRSSLDNFAKATNRSPSDPETQMDFYVREAGIVPDDTGTVRVDPGGAAFAKATDIEGANRALKGFIRYGSPYDKGGEGTRLANALAYQKLYGSDDSPVQVASTDTSAGVAQALNRPQQAATAPAASAAEALARRAPVSPHAAEPAPAAATGPNGLPATAPMGTVAKGADGQAYQYAETTGMAGAKGPSGWFKVNPAAVAQTAQAAPAQVTGGPSVQQLLQASRDPRLTEQQRGVVNLMLKQTLDEANPANQLELEKNRLEVEKLRNPQIEPGDKARLDFDREKFAAEQNKPIEVGGVLVDPKTHQPVHTGQQTDWEKLDERTLYNKRTGETRAVSIGGANAGQFRFTGSSVEAQALNGLMDAGPEKGGLTVEQAQQLAAGKTISGPNGELLFLTPQGVFGQASAGGPAMPVTPPKGAPAAPAPEAPASPAPTSPRAANPPPSENAGILPLTGAKQKPPNEQQQRDNKLYSVVAPELQIVEKNFSALSNPSDQALSAIPHGSDYGAEYLKSPEYQRASNSLRTIIASYLYSVSGATAAPAEVDNQAAILTPKPGEAKASLDDKLARIRQMVDAIKTGGSGTLPAGNAGTGGGTTSNGLKWSIEP
ncbi:MAG: hypothetical protein EOQ79_02200 [Mesorhizobium sp.]|uniref:phage tail tip lysozyme n=2 Tax=Mesorhizobium sp. TaxID=1871066 RepID=UPI000FE47A0F|nr:phage tail tip lysozyme [Mesorhizobium sp.]RWH41202.1 MAG: hypothetical protein EOQ79_02200 [Mesorhizobium sp.]